MRLALVVLLLLLPFLAGCFMDPVESPDADDEVEPEPEPEPWTKRLYLLFPDPCPDEPIGNTTYQNMSQVKPSRECGKGLSSAATTPPPCATFMVHDPNYQLYSGQSVAARIRMEGGPGPVEVRLVWVDDEGILAEGTSQIDMIGRFTRAWNTETSVIRESMSAIRFEIHAEGASCGRISVGDRDASAIWVIDD